MSRPEQVTARLSISQNALHDALADPVLGTGLGVFSGAHGVIVHNTLLWYLTETGVVGLAVFICFLGAYFRRGWLAMRRTTGHARAAAVAAFSGIGVGLGVSVGIEASYQRYWWFMIAATAAGYSLTEAGSRDPARR